MKQEINIKQVEHDIYQLAQYGFNLDDRGIYRQGFSKADWKARNWLLNYFQQHGLIAHIDGAGNVCGRYGKPLND